MEIEDGGSISPDKKTDIHLIRVSKLTPEREWEIKTEEPIKGVFIVSLFKDGEHIFSSRFTKDPMEVFWNILDFGKIIFLEIKKKIEEG